MLQRVIIVLLQCFLRTTEITHWSFTDALNPQFLLKKNACCYPMLFTTGHIHIASVTRNSLIGRLISMLCRWWSTTWNHAQKSYVRSYRLRQRSRHDGRSYMGNGMSSTSVSLMRWRRQLGLLFEYNSNPHASSRCCLHSLHKEIFLRSQHVIHRISIPSWTTSTG